MTDRCIVCDETDEELYQVNSYGIDVWVCSEECEIEAVEIGV